MYEEFLFISVLFKNLATIGNPQTVPRHTQISLSWADEMAMHLPCKLRDWSLVPEAHGGRRELADESCPLTSAVHHSMQALGHPAPQQAVYGAY